MCCKVAQKNLRDSSSMINKRLLIKNLLAHSNENSFFDKKLKLSLSEKEGKAKFLKHVCALSNSNPKNNSYIVVGIKDEDSLIVGVDFFDDSKIQNLINAYLENPPMVSYENIPFPDLPSDKVVGLVTIHPTNTKICRLKKGIWKYYKGTSFLRDGSISMPKEDDPKLKDYNSEIVASIESHSQNNMEYTLDGVFDFMNSRKDYKPTYKVFKEYFVVCWAGKEKRVKRDVYYSRVDIELINEQVRLFYSEFDEVTIAINDNEFIITEFISLGYDGSKKYYPFEKVSIQFKNNASYEIKNKMLFKPPNFAPSVTDFLMKKNDVLVNKIHLNEKLTIKEENWLKDLPNTYLICYLNGVDSAYERLKAEKSLFKNHSEELYKLHKDTLRIIRKLQYS